MDHDAITTALGGVERYGQGITPNPFAPKEVEWARRKQQAALRQQLTDKIVSIFEPRFITTPPTCELMESLITMIGANQILELGTCTAFGSLHFLRAIVGIEGAKVVSIDARPAHDWDFFGQPEIVKHFEFIQGWTPDVLSCLAGRRFDFVFVDSDHSVEHTRKELAALKAITHPGTMICFHDVPEWQTPSNPKPPPVRQYLQSLIDAGEFAGMMLPSPAQLDCEEEYGKGYPNACNPGLAVLIRK